MTPALEQIKALPAKWRDAASKWDNLQSGAEAAFRLRDCAADLDAALQALRDEAGEAVCFGIRRKGTEAIIGVVPAKIASTVPRSDEYRRDYEEIPLYTHPAPAAEAAPQGGVEAIMRKVVDGVMAQREEVLRAFVAKYGFQPDEAVQVVGADGSWRVIRREEMYATPPSAPAVEGLRIEVKPSECACHPETCNCPEYFVAVNGELWSTGSLGFCERLAEKIRRLSAPVPQEGVDVEARKLLRAAVVLFGHRCAHDCTLATWLEDAEAALAAGALPQKVTHQMVLAGNERVPVIDGRPALTYGQVQAIGEAMLAAAPAQGVL